MPKKKNAVKNLFEKPVELSTADAIEGSGDEACVTEFPDFASADAKPDDLRIVAVQYRDELIDELARLDAFIDWADRVTNGEQAAEIGDLCILTKNGNVHVLH